MIIQPLFNAPVCYTTNLGDLNTNSTCLDVAISTGIYFFTGGSSYPNESGTVGEWTLLVLENGDSILQIAERLGLTASRIIYSRSYVNNTWSNWVETGTSSSSSSDDTIVCDSALSTSSTNPVQNKVITNKLNDIDSNINDIGSSLDYKLNISGGTMTGQLKAQSNTDYTTYQVRNMAFSTTASVPTGNGSVLGVYS